ncbi:MAG: hypothetical protein Q9182_003982 [Xanthomendoza sp. 2 TL-2023]
MSTSIIKPRVVVIVGTTGTGKSQLAVALAERFDGEIINGDALQMYEGLPIATNKLPLAERRSIPHHLLGCVQLDAETWTVGKYVRHANAIVRDIVARGKLPIVVGGSHYYTQSLLFQANLVDKGSREHLSVEAQEAKWPILAASTGDMLARLHAIDPEIASRLHPNDRRKIRHSLEVYLTLGKKLSDLYQEQRYMASASVSSPKSILENGDQALLAAPEPTSELRFDPLLFWVHVDLKELPARLDQRVDNMIRAGLIEEVEAMQQYLQKQQQNGVSIDQSSGIWTAIGFKELLQYVSTGPDRALNANGSEAMKKQGIELTRIATRQYARRQQRWIRNKLLRALKENNMLPHLVVLDGTELSQWKHNVEAIAVDAVTAFLAGNPLPNSSALSKAVSEMVLPPAEPQIKARYCENCKVTLMTQLEWDAHTRSKKHRKATRIPVDWQAINAKTKATNSTSPTACMLDNGLDGQSISH